MPEGPEIRRMADSVASGVEDRVADAVFFAFDSLSEWQQRLTGRTVEQVYARGKALLVRFSASADDCARTVYTHNQLYGKWLVGSTARPPETGRQLRFAITAGKKCARLYSASQIQVVAADDVQQVAYIARLGPDPINQVITHDQLLQQFNARGFVRRRLGGLLLDQHFVAGLGNYLRSEILFVAGLVPDLRPCDLDAPAQDRLARAIATLTERAYRHRGITNDPAAARQLEAQGVSFGRRRHYVFARAGRPCRECGTAVEKCRVAGRRLYYCPRCQPPGPG